METEQEFYEKMWEKWGPFNPILIEWKDRLNELAEDNDPTGELQEEFCN